MSAATMPKTQRCPLGSYSAHTYNFEQDECIWCGPNRLAWQPGHWEQCDGYQAWTATEPFLPESIKAVSA